MDIKAPRRRKTCRDYGLPKVKEYLSTERASVLLLLLLQLKAPRIFSAKEGKLDSQYNLLLEKSILKSFVRTSPAAPAAAAAAAERRVAAPITVVSLPVENSKLLRSSAAPT